MRGVPRPLLALIAVTLGCLAALGSVSLAQQQIEPLTAGRTAPPSDGYNVFIIGDALAGGLWAGTGRVADRCPGFAVDGRFKEESGLARPEFYDWAAAVPKILERQYMDIA